MKDAVVLAQLHKQTLKGGFLSSLGSRFLVRLYRSMIGSSRAVVLVARDGDGVVGFAAGSVSPGTFWREFLRRHLIPVGGLLTLRALRPSVAKRMLEVARHLKREAGQGSELLAIGVGPPARRMGLGLRLVMRMEEELRRKGAHQVAVAVRVDNRPARDFFERSGFHPLGGLQVHEGHPSLRYEKQLG
jgi:ribosomal protein S18 acetylase RimI-like enzyme